MASAIVEESGPLPWLGYASTANDNIELGGNFRLQLSLEAKNVQPRLSCFNAGQKFQAYAVVKLLSNDECLGKTEWYVLTNYTFHMSIYTSWIF